jgi:hypothetical protein
VEPQIKQLSAGLYLVATPIGTARDITLRALDILASAEMLVAEDTRTCRHLMEIHGIALAGRKIIAYHDHSSDRTRTRIIEVDHRDGTLHADPQAVHLVAVNQRLRTIQLEFLQARLQKTPRAQ